MTQGIDWRTKESWELMRFAEQIAALTEEQRLHFYELLAHNLTVSMRLWSDERLADAEKVARMKWINELLHRVTAKVWVLRLKTHEWTESDFGELVQAHMESHTETASEIRWAIRQSYLSVAGQEMDEA